MARQYNLQSGAALVARPFDTSVLRPTKDNPDAPHGWPRLSCAARSKLRPTGAHQGLCSERGGRRLTQASSTQELPAATQGSGEARSRK